MTEDIKFEGGQTTRLKDEFRERKEYKEYEGFNRYDILDTHYKDFKYGMINREYEPITVMSEQEEQTLRNFPDFAEDVKVLPFVAAAFEDFRKHYRTFIENSSNPEVTFPKHIEGITPLRGYVNFATEFAAYLSYSMETLKRQLVNDAEIKNFDIFLEKFFDIFEETGKEFPITKSGYITSNHCSIMTSGLCIELAGEEYNIDMPKGEMITTPNFDCYAEHANKYGFLVDKYVPWRLVADLNSEAMKGYMIRGKNISRHGVLDFYESVYTSKSHYDDLYMLRNHLFRAYHFFYRNNSDTMEPLPRVSISKLLSILLRVRSIEIGIPYEKMDSDQKILDIYNQYGLTYAQGHIGQLASKRLKELYGPK